MRLIPLICVTFCVVANSAFANAQTSASPSTIKESVALINADIANMLQNLNFFDSSSLNPVNWPVDFFDYDDQTKTVMIRGSYDSSVEVIPSFLTMSGVSVEVTLTVTAGDPLHPDSSLRVALAGFEVSGTWAVGGIKFDLTITKDSEGLTLAASPNPSTVSMNSFLMALGESNFLPDGLDAVLSANAGLDSFSLHQTEFAAFYSKTTGYAISLSGYPSISGWGSIKLTVLLQRLAGQSSVVTMTAAFPSFTLSSLVKQLTGIDMSAVPVIGSLTLPEIGLVISSKDLNPSLLPNNYPLLGDVEPFEKGVTVAATFSLISGGPPTTYVIRLNKGNVTFDSTTGSFSITVGQLLQTLIPGFDSSSVELPPGIPDVFAIEISDFSYDAGTKSITVAMALAGDVDLIPNVVTISDPTLTVDVTLTKPRKIAVSGDASWTIGSANLPLTIERAADGNGFVVRASGSRIAVGEVLTQFGASLLPGELEPILHSSGLDTFEIHNPITQLDVRSGVKDMQLYLSGVPSIAGWAGVTLNSVLVKKGSSKTIMAAGFDFADTNFANLLRSVTGLDVSGISLLDQGMKVAVIISPQSIPGVSLQGDLLSELSISRGLSIIGSFNFPADCGSDLLCQIGKTAVGSNADIRLAATITSVKQFVLTAGLADISLGAGLTLNPAALEFQLGVETSIGITGGLTLSNPPLQFQGAIRAGTQGLELELTMQGVWKRAFAIPYLAFGNLIISTNIIPGVPLPGLQVGGEVRIGDLDSGRELIGQCYVGFDPVNPRRNYYYASINKASIGAILNAFGMSAPLPRVLTESGFPDGLSSSFAFDDVEPVPGVLVPAGFKLNGTMNIIGYRVSADINVDPPNGVTIDLNMDPFNLANGLFKLYRSRDDSSKGPRFYASIKALPIPSVVVKASGYARVLNMIESAAELEISNTEYIMTISGRLFVFDTSLRISASYGSLQSASFRVYGLLTSRLNDIKGKALEYIQNGANAATQAIGNAQAEVDKAQAAFDAAVRKLADAKWKVAAAQRKFDDAVGKLNSAQNTVNGLCSIRSCSSVCVGCPGWDGCCRKVWGSCIGCPGWNGCCYRVPDPTCVAANAACEGIRAAAYAALEAAKTTLRGARYTLDAAKGVVAAAQVVVDQSRHTLDGVKAALEVVKAAVKAGADAASAITRLTLGGLMNIHKMEFNVHIAVAATGSFSGTMEATLLGAYSRFSFNLNLKSVDQMARDLAEKVFPGITSSRKRRSAVEETRSDDHPMRPHHPHNRKDVDNEHDTDGVERALERERRRHDAVHKQIEHEAKKLKAAANRTDYAPQQAIHLSADDLHLDMLNARPATHEEACLQAKAMVTVLHIVADVAQSVCDGWAKSVKEFESETAKMGVGMQSNETNEDVEMLVRAVNEWKRGSRRYLGHQNDDALRVALDRVLGHEIERLSGMKLRIYLRHVMAALLRPYHVFAQRNIRARHIVRLIDEATPMVNGLFDKTIDAASRDVDRFVEAVTRLQRATSTEEFCR